MISANFGELKLGRMIGSAVHALLASSLRNRPEPDSVTSAQDPSPQWHGPLFVVGLWRSGTSLLYALLNKHPQIALMYEGDLFLLRPAFWVPGAGPRWLARWQFWNNALTRHGLAADRIPPNLSRLQTAMETAYQEYARQKGRLIWGEKSPNYYDSLTRLAQVFPSARFITIWRDPAAICGSLIRAGKEPGWFDRSGMVDRALLGHRVLKRQCDRLESRGVPLHQIQYEILVKDPAGVMAGVCRFLGVTFVPAVASLEGADRSAIYEGRLHRHHAVVKGDRILSSPERARGLPSDLERKIERYVSLWQEESGGSWPAFPPQRHGQRKPGLAERVLDLCRYAYFRSLDFAVVAAYSFAPLRLLRAWRSHRQRRLTLRHGGIPQPIIHNQPNSPDPSA